MSKLPPGPPARSVVTLARWALRPLELLDECAERFGDCFTFEGFGAQTVVFFTRPEAVKEIFTASAEDLYAGQGNAILEAIVGKNSLLLLDGAPHARERKLLMPPFHGERMNAYGRVMRDITDARVDGWEKRRAFSIQDEASAITLEVILRTVFGVEEAERLEHLRERLSVFVREGANPLVLTLLLTVPAETLTRVLMAGTDPEEAFWKRNLRSLLPFHALAMSGRDVDQGLLAEIRRRREEGTGDRTDILSLLLDARYEEGDGMSDEALRDEMVTLLLAGHETTAVTLAWVFHRLLLHPEVLLKVQDELQAVAGGAPPEPEHVPKLDYLDAVIRETQRVHTIIPLVVRRLQRDMTIGGVDLPKGVLVAPAIPLLHKRKDVWGDPEAFRPERFLERKPTPFEFLPFGGGVRRCIGAAFAHYEMKVVLARILWRATLRAEGPLPTRTVRRGVTLGPKDGMPVVLEARREVSA
ncbi:MAG: cytochrome P450 [Deltaproteobacteria bacterium]|nr:cytochrome P450 [Deltaproteobacteria bacterium]